MTIINVTRRDFLKATGLSVTGLMIGFRSTASAATGSSAPDGAFSPNAFIAINQGGGITLAISCPEIGQNIRTTFAMILADELGADLDAVTLYQAPPGDELGRQTAGGSGSVRKQFLPMREAAAAAREMLIAAAAKEWGARPTQCSTKDSFVHGPGGKKISFEDIAEKASKESVPGNPTLKKPSEYTYIGKPKLCMDTEAIVTGKMQFGVDALPENCAFAVMLRCPVHQGTLKGFNAEKAKNMPHVRDIFRIDEKIAVIADNTWAAINASKAVDVDWDYGKNGSIDTDEQNRERSKAVKNPRNDVAKIGNFKKAYDSARTKLEAEMAVPMIAHVSMEPPNSTTWVHDAGIEIWGSAQTLNALYDELPKMTGLPHDKITYHQLRIGGGFGRKLARDYVEESIQIAQKVDYPVKMTFTREDDIHNDRYRIPGQFYYRVGLGKNGYPEAVEENGIRRPKNNRPSHMMRYFANAQSNFTPVNAGVQGGALRAPGHNITSFCDQSLIDMMAEKAGIDPIDYQLALHGDPEMVGKLDWPKAPREEPIICELLRTVRQDSNWKKNSKYGYGVATFSGYGSHCALVALVPKNGGKRPVEKVYAAVHCGQVINPLGAKAQIEGGIIDCLSATLYQLITLKNGRVQQNNFNDYKLMRMPEHPEVEISIVDSTDDPQGLGEVSYPPMAAATTNALFDATGRRFTKLPLRG